MRRPLPVRDLIEFVLRPAEGEAQHRDAEPILHARIDLAKAVLVGDHLTAQRHPDRRARSTADRLLQPRAPDPRQGSGRRDPETAADLAMIAAWKIQGAALPLPIQPKGAYDVLPACSVPKIGRTLGWE